MSTMHIIYEDKDFAVVNKPAGVLFDWAIAERPDFITVHRLDKDTSGVMLFAKNQKTAEYFKLLFQSHQIQKTYRALIVGDIAKDHGTIELPLARSAASPLKRIAVDSAIGRTKKMGKYRGILREASTEYKVLKRFPDYTYVEAYPKTGRTHQIRAHFTAIGHPLVCDPVYAGKRLRCPFGIQRHFLHALSIEFVSPKGKKVAFKADLPSDLKNVLRKLGEK
jgi:23S rRNA pseudouridine1911/1915/1917 synthase